MNDNAIINFFTQVQVQNLICQPYSLYENGQDLLYMQ